MLLLRASVRRRAPRRILSERAVREGQCEQRIGAGQFDGFRLGGSHRLGLLLLSKLLLGAGGEDLLDLGDEAGDGRLDHVTKPFAEVPAGEVVSVFEPIGDELAHLGAERGGIDFNLGGGGRGVDSTAECFFLIHGNL